MQNRCSSTRDEIQDDGDVYDRLRLGWNLRFSRRNALCKPKLEGLKMNSFKNVLLYDAYQSKNPDFNYQQYDPFNLDGRDNP